MPLYEMVNSCAKAVEELLQTKITFADPRSCLRSLLKRQKVKTIA
jgi:hypothetical protein